MAFQKLFNSIIILLIAQSSYAQYRFSIGPDVGVSTDIFKRETNKFSVNPYAGLNFSALFYARFGFQIGYYHSNLFDKIDLPDEDLNIRLEMGLRQVPTKLELVVFKNSKDLYSLVPINDVIMVSVLAGFHNTLQGLSFARIKNSVGKTKIDPEELENRLNSLSSNKYVVSLHQSDDSFHFLSSPTFGIKVKFKDYKKTSSSLEINYIFESNPLETIRIQTNTYTYNQSIKRQILLIKYNLSLFYEK